MNQQSADIDLCQYQQVGSTVRLFEFGKIPVQLKGAVSRMGIMTGEFGEADFSKNRKQTIILYDGVQLHHYQNIETLSIIQRKKPSKEGPVANDKQKHQNNQNQVSEHHQSSQSQQQSQEIIKKTNLIKKQTKNKRKNLSARKMTKSSLKNRLKFLNQLQKKIVHKNELKLNNNHKSEGIKTRNAKSKNL